MSAIVFDKKARPIADQLQPSDREGRTQYLPMSQDWIEMVKPATGSTSGTIGTVTFTDTEYVADEFFNIGDKLRLKQGGDYKYFYVVGSNANTILVTAGDDYTLAAADITNMALSRVANPSGHPQIFQFSPDDRTVGLGVSVFGGGNGWFYMVGTIVHWWGSYTGGQYGSIGTYIYTDLPVPFASGNINNSVTLSSAINGVDNYIVTALRPDYSEQALAIYPHDFNVTWDGDAAPSGALFIQWSLFYVIE